LVAPTQSELYDGLYTEWKELLELQANEGIII